MLLGRLLFSEERQGEILGERARERREGKLWLGSNIYERRASLNVWSESGERGCHQPLISAILKI